MDNVRELEVIGSAQWRSLIVPICKTIISCICHSVRDISGGLDMLLIFIQLLQVYLGKEVLFNSPFLKFFFIQ